MVVPKAVPTRGTFPAALPAVFPAALPIVVPLGFSFPLVSVTTILLSVVPKAVPTRGTFPAALPAVFPAALPITVPLGFSFPLVSVTTILLSVVPNAVPTSGTLPTAAPAVLTAADPKPKLVLAPAAVLEPVPPFTTFRAPSTGIAVSPLKSLVSLVLAVPSFTYTFLAIVSFFALAAEPSIGKYFSSLIVLCAVLLSV